jgi:hypothetical protein
MLTLAPGGMGSSAQLWEMAAINPLTAHAGQYRMIALDQRNAGQSARPLETATRGAPTRPTSSPSPGIRCGASARRCSSCPESTSTTRPRPAARSPRPPSCSSPGRTPSTCPPPPKRPAGSSKTTPLLAHHRRVVPGPAGGVLYAPMVAGAVMGGHRIRVPGGRVIVVEQQRQVVQGTDLVGLGGG